MIATVRDRARWQFDLSIPSETFLSSSGNSATPPAELPELFVAIPPDAFALSRHSPKLRPRTMGATLFDKVWNEHVVDSIADGVDLIHIDRHLLHDLNGVGGLREIKRLGYRVRNPELTFATPDHAISSEPGRDTDRDAAGAKYVAVLREESRALGIRMFDLGQDGQGIVHVIGPELGLSLPGTTIVCGDSHTCTHGAVGALAFGIGSTELRSLPRSKPRPMRG